MATNELPEKPSDEDFETARRYVAPRLQTPSIRERARARAVLRYLLAEHDARPAPVAVPEDVVTWARAVADARLPGCSSTKEMAADWILSLVPEPVVEWREGRNRETGNTRWELYIDDEFKGGVFRDLLNDEPTWRVTDFEGTDSLIADLAAAKSRAESLCGVSSKKGG